MAERNSRVGCVSTALPAGSQRKHVRLIPLVRSSNHVTGCGHKWRSWNYLISLGKFWAPSSLKVQGLFSFFFQWICLLWNSISFKSFLSCVNVGNFNLRWQCVLWYLRKNRTTASTILCIRKLCACSWL